MKSTKIVKNYLYNTVYQILILVTPLITTPYISRVLGVTNIGIYQYAQSIAYYFVLIGAVGTTLYGQREIAYLQDLPQKRSKAFWEIEIFRIASTFLCAAFFLLFFCGNNKYSAVFRVLILEIIANAFEISWFYMGMENFRATVTRNIIVKITGIVCVFLFVKGPDDLLIFTICVTAPTLLGNVSLWLGIHKYLEKTSLSIHELISGIGRRLKNILALFIPQVAMDVYLVLDKTMIGIFGSSIDQVGYYSQGQKVVKIVLAIVTSLGTVMLPAMSAYFAKGDYETIKKHIRTAFQFVYMLAFSLMFGLCAIAGRFVPLFFGKGYEPVIPLIIIISPILVVIGTSNVVGRQYLLPTNQQRAFTVSILTGAGVNFILNFLLIHFFDAIGASIATVIAEIGVTVVQCLYVKKQLPLKEYLISGIKYALFGFLMFAGVKLLDSLLPKEDVWPLVLLILAGVVIYLTELVISKDPMVKTSINFLKYRRQVE